MKYLKVFLAVIILISLVISPVMTLAQSNLLPEKTSESSSASSSNSTSTSDKAGTPKDDTLTWASIIAVLMGFAFFLLFLEIAIIPGFGVCGVSGIILLLISLVLSFWKLSRGMATVVTAIAVFGSVFLIYYMIYILPNTKLGTKLILADSSAVPRDEDEYAVESTNRFLGAEGVAISNLRPSGIAKIADERVDVITEGDFLEKGTKIKVVKTTAGRVIVSAIE